MKINLVNSTILALAVVMATAGCKHKPVAVTPIPPGQGAPVTDIGGGGTINSGNAYGNNGGMGSGPAPLALGNYDPSNFTQDHDKLAADSIHFKFDSAVVQDNEQASLQAVAQELQNNPREELLVEGNCDERGTEEYNRSLGERRALAAREGLAKLGINPMRVHEISYGKDKPADPGHDDAAFAKNRRDDFVVLTPKMGA